MKEAVKMKGKIVCGVIITITITTAIYYFKKNSLSSEKEISSNQNEKKHQLKENIKEDSKKQESSYEEEAQKNAKIKVEVSEGIKERHTEAASIMRKSINNIVSEKNMSSITENEADLAEMDRALNDLLDE